MQINTQMVKSHYVSRKIGAKLVLLVKAFMQKCALGTCKDNV